MVLTVNVFDDAPAATVTLAGTVAAASLLTNGTVVAVWPRALKVTVPVAELPPKTARGFKLRVETVTEVGVGSVLVELVKTSRAALAPLTCNAMSGLASPLKSAETITPPPTLESGGGIK